MFDQIERNPGEKVTSITHTEGREISCGKKWFNNNNPELDCRVSLTKTHHTGRSDTVVIDQRRMDEIPLMPNIRISKNYHFGIFQW